MPWLFNTVAPCKKLRFYVSVYRIFVNKQDAVAIFTVLKTVFDKVHNRHPNFKRGENIKQTMVDYSDAEENGLRLALVDDFVEKVLRGCNFHFLQSAVKMANTVTTTERQEKVFIHICQITTPLQNQDHVMQCLQVLNGELPVGV